VGSSLLLPRPWAALLRLLLQAGVPSDALRSLAGPPCGRDAALEAVVWAALPRGARDTWDAHPRRMGTTEDEVGHTPMRRLPVPACREIAVHLQHGTWGAAYCSGSRSPWAPSWQGDWRAGAAACASG